MSTWGSKNLVEWKAAMPFSWMILHYGIMNRRCIVICYFLAIFVDILHTEKSLKFHLVRCEERSQLPTSSSTVFATGSPDASIPNLPNGPCHSDDSRTLSTATSMPGPSVSSPSSQRLWDSDSPSWSTQSIDSRGASSIPDLGSMPPNPDGWLDFFLTHPLLGAQSDSAALENNAPPHMASQIPPTNTAELPALSPPSFSLFLEAPLQPTLSAGLFQPIYYPSSQPEAPLSQSRHEQMRLSQVGTLPPMSAPSQLALINDHTSNASYDISVCMPVPGSNPGSSWSISAPDLADTASLFESSNRNLEYNYSATLPPNVTGGAFSDSLRWPISCYDGMTLNSAWFNPLC
ncbi:hypothetical protein BS47DRAFT_1210225 [Hydnum rufescens UP504]|uniref:Uncharacterized protein n=1 Tax=Hydnum rufescens UP504 TaxID=1448309 RepID=A0A9P6ASK8_9AGAM|nr:hypothetical protein BS47DRAFT_1210225 [Hydnum rufescens UP504]